MTPPRRATGEAGRTHEGRRGSVPHTTVAKDGALWRWQCRHCERSDAHWRHHEAVAEALVHLSRHTTFGFGRKR